MQDLELEKLNKELAASLEHLRTIQTTYNKLKECRKLGKLVNITNEDLRATRWALKRNGYSVESLDLLSLSTESGQLRFSEIDLAIEGLGDALLKMWNKIKELFKKMFGWLFDKSKETPEVKPIKESEIKIKVVTKKADGSTTTSKHSLDEVEKGAKVQYVKLQELEQRAKELRQQAERDRDEVDYIIKNLVELKDATTLHHKNKGDSTIITDFDKEIGIKTIENAIKIATNIIENCLGGCSSSQFTDLLGKLDAEVMDVLNKEMKPMGAIDAHAVSADYAEMVKNRLGNFIKSTNKFLRANVDRFIIEDYTDEVLRLCGNFSAGFIRYKKDRLSITEGTGSSATTLTLYTAKFGQTEHIPAFIKMEIPLGKGNLILNPIAELQKRLASTINNNKEYIYKSIKGVEKNVTKLINDVKPLLDYPPNQNTSYAVEVYLHILQEIGTFVTMNVNTAININNKYLLKMSRELEQLLGSRKLSMAS